MNEDVSPIKKMVVMFQPAMLVCQSVTFSVWKQYLDEVYRDDVIVRSRRKKKTSDGFRCWVKWICSSKNKKKTQVPGKHVVLPIVLAKWIAVFRGIADGN